MLYLYQDKGKANNTRYHERQVNNMATANNITNEVTIENAWDILLDMGVSEQTLNIITSINGYNLKTLENVLYAHAGYNSFDQL